MLNKSPLAFAKVPEELLVGEAAAVVVRAEIVVCNVVDGDELLPTQYLVPTLMQSIDNALEPELGAVPGTHCE